jgi:hypothetical protein
MNRFLVAEICFCVLVAVAGAGPAVILCCCVLAVLVYQLVKTIIREKQR